MSETHDDKGKTDHTSSIEKGGVHDYVVQQTDARYHFDVADLDRVQRKLNQRHVQMIAVSALTHLSPTALDADRRRQIAGTLGTGLFLGSGQALAGAGPLGTLLAYAFVATTAYASLSALGEMTAHAPVSGTFPHFAARWVDPAFGFATG